MAPPADTTPWKEQEKARITHDVVTALKKAAVMEKPPLMSRTTSLIREEKEDLQSAAKESFNVCVDLTLEGKIRWVSGSWSDVIGIKPEEAQDKPIADMLVDDKDCFDKALEIMKKDDSRSFKIRFAVMLGPLSSLLQDPMEAAVEAENEGFRPEEVDDVNNVLEMEGQGILVFDRGNGEPSHTMWVLRPWVEPKEITIDLPQPIIESLGVGAGMLAHYLTSLAEAGTESGTEGVESYPPPAPVLCRICERQIQPWWFEKHSELCMLEHKAESEVQLAHENLQMQRQAIVKVLDALSKAASSRGQQQADANPSKPLVEYRGFPIGPPSAPSSGTASPNNGPTKPKESQVSTSVKSKFGVRRPQVRIVELLLDLCDTALEINTPAITPGEGEEGSQTFRTQSPGSEARVSQVMQWQSPSTNTLDQEHGLQLLCSDTESVSRAKVDSVLRHRNTIEYSERIRLEFSYLVQECIDEAVRKATESDEVAIEDGYEEGDISEQEEDDDNAFFGSPFNGSLAHSMSLDSEASFIDKPLEHSMLITDSPQSNNGSPRICSTPKSQRSFSRLGGRRSRLSLQSSFASINDPQDSDGSCHSSLAAAVTGKMESPVSDHDSKLDTLSRARAQKKRHTVGFFKNSGSNSGNNSPARQHSPSRPSTATSTASPMRAPKPRLSAIFDGHIPTPITSPLLCTGDFSPALDGFHHRRQSSATSSDLMRPPPPQSPRLSSVQQPPQKVTAPSIKDFEIIKPISKGAFGSVYLSKKKTTGDYFAIKVLKKADMIAKNQVTNVRAERAIMMVQGESDFVAKLFWTFSSKDYLYLVMEYLNGGDCAALVKALGGLPEDWAQKYLAEVVLGVENLHERGIIHRDLKPDNLLIDQRGHLKLTDFGLSRMGLLGRQKRALQGSAETTPDLLNQGPFARARSVASSRSASFDFPPGGQSPANTPVMTPDTNIQLNAPSYFNLNRVESNLSRENSIKHHSRRNSQHRSDSGGSETLVPMFNSFSLNETTNYAVNVSRQNSKLEEDVHSNSDASSDFSNNTSLQHTASNLSTMSQGTTATTSSMMPPQLALFDPEDNDRKFVGTPDYLAPETINGTGQDEMSDWWSIGCILFEFLYGYPPFHADTHDKVFDNILNRRIAWPDEDDVPVSDEAMDLMNKLMCTDQTKRLGAHGTEEVRNHPFFKDIIWDQILDDEASFIPAPENIEDTEYFDNRGATLQAFTEELEDAISSQAGTPASEVPDRPHDAVPRGKKEFPAKRGLMPLHIPPHVRESGRSRRLSEPVAADDFGTFQFRNLPVLDKANKDVIQRLRTEAQAMQSNNSSASPSPSPAQSMDGSPNSSKGVGRTLSTGSRNGKRSVSPSNLHTPSTASPNRMSQPSSPLLVSFSARKASNASSSSNNSSGLGEVPRLSTNFKMPASATGSPVKLHQLSPVKSHPKLAQTPLSPRREGFSNPRRSGSTRVRSLTVGSQEGEPPAFLDSLKQYKRRSQVFDMSPSSSDNEDSRSSALLRVQRRRQSSRRLSTISLNEGPMFRPLDVLVCEDHPVSRMVMERMLEKLQCRTMCVDNGGEAVRYAMGDVKFDLILTEFRLPQINGEDLSRMVKTSRNTNSNTPIVAVTGYLRDLKAPHHFDELLEKPATPGKLIAAMQRLCHWKPSSDKALSPRASTFPAAMHDRRPSLERTITAPLRRPASMMLPGTSSDSLNLDAHPIKTRIGRSNSDLQGQVDILPYAKPPSLGKSTSAQFLSDESSPTRSSGMPFSRSINLNSEQRRSRLSLTSFAPNSPTSPAPPVPEKSADRSLRLADSTSDDVLSPRSHPSRPLDTVPQEQVLELGESSFNNNFQPIKELQPSPDIERGSFNFARPSLLMKRIDSAPLVPKVDMAKHAMGNNPSMNNRVPPPPSKHMKGEHLLRDDSSDRDIFMPPPINSPGAPVSPQKQAKPIGNPQALTSKVNRLGARTKSLSPENNNKTKLKMTSMFDQDKAYLNTPPDSADDESSSGSWTKKTFKSKFQASREKKATRNFFSEMKRAKSDD